MDEIDEVALLKAYNLDNLQPTVWTEVDHSTSGGAQRDLINDEPDPLGLRGVLPLNRMVDKETIAQVHPSSKTFDPKTFLSTVHPDATFADLNSGNAFLKHSIEQRSEALRILVESNFDKFVAVKATTDGVYREMRESKEGPLHEENEYGIGRLKGILGNASAKADQVFMPVLENNLKAVKLRSTLSVFERSRFFFNLPGSLGEAIEAGKYDQALRDYKRGKYLMESRPGQLLTLTTSNSANLAGLSDVNSNPANAKQHAQQQRVFAKVWDAVEATMQDMRDRLLKQLQEPRRPVEEQEKTIEILQELDIGQDPVAVFLESQHMHIRNLMRKSFDTGIAKVEAASSIEGLVNHGENERAKDLQACVRQLSQPEQSFDRMIGVQGWKAILDLVRLVCETMSQTLPSFWRVIADGKLKTRSSAIQAQARAWATENVEAFVATLVQFFHLTDVSILARQDLSTLPAWVPKSCSMTAGYFLNAILSELNEAVNDLKALKIGTTADTLQNLLVNSSFCFVEVLCQLWQEDAKIFHRLEDWTLNPEEEATTIFLGEVAAFHTNNARTAYQLASTSGKDNAAASANSTTKAVSSSTSSSTSITIPTEFTLRIKATFVDAIYVFLDGLVHLAFSEYNPLDTTTSVSQKLLVDPSTKQRSVIDVKELDTRILLAVTNLSHFTRVIVPGMAKQFHEAFRARMGEDLRTIDEVAVELDKILFSNFIERKSKIVNDIFQKGILESGIEWNKLPKPAEVHAYIYEALLALVQIHAQVRAVAKPLVARTIRTLLEQLASIVLESFGNIDRFGMGGMLQATLEIEFVHQTLAVYVTPNSEKILKQIYETISQKYVRQSGAKGEEENASLQTELESVKRILVASRKATALEFLCFRKPRETATPSTAPAGQSQGGVEREKTLNVNPGRKR
ncbi:uncharacterized protein FA14DRAFT_14429 [Meira miltonrushii]|uniref:Exocyst complex component SEC5 n=1 Tax=Meira miltonrushii TaxID=1280837 RepID=A0A316VN04_9BASI|nr:uncharacterized protein FA14DRAFT_14429 [Meira miltonrushii]PWN37481.1 hypothetical protein FA14DRAFT_14429 [Meira miltonrushii]